MTIKKIVMIILSGALVLIACGKKAPPTVVCSSNPELAITHLSYQVEDLGVTLSWMVDNQEPATDYPFDAFSIQRARIDTQDCHQCPYLFQKAGEVQVMDKDKDAFYFHDRLAEGFQYVYQVVGISEKDSLQVASQLLFVRMDVTETQDTKEEN